MYNIVQAWAEIKAPVHTFVRLVDAFQLIDNLLKHFSIIA